MPVLAKICGLSTAEAVAAAAAGGAGYVGLVFYDKSPRAVTPEQAAEITRDLPDHVAKVGLFVDAGIERIRDTVRVAKLDMLQLHGRETPATVERLRTKLGRTVIKAIKIGAAEDFAQTEPYEDIADWLLFDAKTPKTLPGALPGGNRLSFDWSLLKGRRFGCPWMLAGGLDAGNLAEAVAASGARAVDVSSGVEDAPGVKNPDLIRAFLAAAAAI
ncbi:MAG: phosphoribosylanthranilate isomerase [Alphaproteobacteria bacterium]|nr:phosphoribosylanthranilate isomerase [Alphaproteobacteria bacterium]